MNKAASIVCRIFSPLLIPTYGVIIGLFLTDLPTASPNAKIYLSLFCLFVTCIVPLTGIYLLYRLKVVGSMELKKREERFFPLLMSGLGCLCFGFILYRAHAPMWLSGIMFGAVVSILTTVIVNLWWKISIYATATAGLTAVCFRILVEEVEKNTLQFSCLTICIILIAGIIGSCRIYQLRHNACQIITGYALGFCSVYFITGI